METRAGGQPCALPPARPPARMAGAPAGSGSRQPRRSPAGVGGTGGPGLPSPTPLTCIRYTQSSLKGCSRLVSWIFLMTSTLFGDLFHVRRWLAGSWMCLGGERGVHSRTGAASPEVCLWWPEHTSVLSANGTRCQRRAQTGPRISPAGCPAPGALHAAGGMPGSPRTPKPAGCGPCPQRPRHGLLPHHAGATAGPTRLALEFYS